MNASEDIIYLLKNGQLPENILKDHKRVVGISFFITNELETIFNQALDSAVEDCHLSISESSNLTDKLGNTSKKFDIQLIKCAVQDSETFDDVLESFTIGLHHRSPKMYTDVVAEELAKKNLPNDVWLKILNRPDSWYFRTFNQIETIVIIKALETAPNPETIAGVVNNYSKMTSYSFNILIYALRQTTLSHKTWEEVKKLSNRKEVKKECDEKLNQ
jgi:hypothetical protein